MKLNKRYVRNIRENLSFYLSATVLTIVTLLLYFLFNIAGNAILDFGEEFFQKNQLEDAHFSTYLPIPEEDLSSLEDKYDLTLEAQHYINLETKGVTARVFLEQKRWTCMRSPSAKMFQLTMRSSFQRDMPLPTTSASGTA